MINRFLVSRFHGEPKI